MNIPQTRHSVRGICFLIEKTRVPNIQFSKKMQDSLLCLPATDSVEEISHTVAITSLSTVLLKRPQTKANAFLCPFLFDYSSFAVLGARWSTICRQNWCSQLEKIRERWLHRRGNCRTRDSKHNVERTHYFQFIDTFSTIYHYFEHIILNLSKFLF